jgi:hypothetical protein
MKTTNFLNQLRQFAEKNPKSSSAMLVVSTAIACGEIVWSCFGTLIAHLIFSSHIMLSAAESNVNIFTELDSDNSGKY